MVSPIAQKVDRVAVLAIAYHNIGVEQEFLKRLDQSLHSYRKGVEIAETHLGTLKIEKLKCSKLCTILDCNYRQNYFYSFIPLLMSSL